MNEIGKLIVALVSVFSLIGSTVFVLNMMSGAVRISQGDYNATQDMAKDFADEATDTIMWSVVIDLLIVIAGALGLGFLVKILKRL
jgi:hypothetical protein